MGLLRFLPSKLGPASGAVKYSMLQTRVHHSLNPNPSRLKRKHTPDPSAMLSSLKIHVIQAKLSQSQISHLMNLVESSGARLVPAADEADVLVTSIAMRARLERHVKWEKAKEKAIVTPEWLQDSVQRGEVMPFDKYVAVPALGLPTPPNSTDHDSVDTKSGVTGSKSKRLKSKPPSTLLAHPSSSTTPTATTTPSHLDYKSLYACQRASPLTCPNQDLVSQLSVIRKSRELESEDRSSLSYMRAIATIKAYPRRITSEQQVKDLPYIGKKIFSMITEFVQTGNISAAQEIASTTRFATLDLFASIYGIGPVTARKLYDVGARTIEDLEAYYDVDAPPVPVPTQAAIDNPDADDVRMDSDDSGSLLQKKTAGKRGWSWLEDEEDQRSWICTGLKLHADLSKKIPRAEVEEMARLVREELEAIQPGCTSTIVGGYRRGKPESNDVDIVFTHPDLDNDDHLCARLVNRLKERGMVTHAKNLSSFHSPDSVRKGNWDKLQKSFTVFRLPPTSPLCPPGPGGALHRRLDLIFAPSDVYGCAVLGWTGSVMFERDIRNWAKKQKGWKFDSSGITRRSDTSRVVARTEREAFEVLGLSWVDPTLRNADA